MMRFADSVRTRCALLLVSAATIGVAVHAWPTHQDRHHHGTQPLQAMHGCGARPRAVVAQVQPVVEDPYVATLRGARVELEKCMATHPEMQVRLAIDVAPSGKVDNVEVRTSANDLTKVDLHVVKCVQAAVSPLEFPSSADPKRISTFLNK